VNKVTQLFIRYLKKHMALELEREKNENAIDAGMYGV